MKDSLGKKLEQYTLKKPQEVLIVRGEIENKSDVILIFKGFSSSLMHPTAFDPDIPVLPDVFKIISIDRVASPYNPDSPRYIQQNLSLSDMEFLLSDIGL
ncbi:hypothetical protein H6F32_12055 [Anabaena sp. FACHB-1237]|nr:hypothetical protein [Anabaena sp. FACHB-1237]MBD2138307.1 hypothetical protein [Anabaena sp. FACHB-1237]